MKTICLVAVLLLSQTALAGEIRLTVLGEGIAGKKIHVAIHDSAEGFPGDNKHRNGKVVDAESDHVEISLTDIEPGYYALSAFADMNGNGELDTSFIGVPSEPIGASNDASGNFGPPEFVDASFHVGDDVVTQTIHLE